MREEKYADISLADEQASLLGFKSFTESERYIQVKDVRYTLDEFNRVGDFLLGRNFQKPNELAEKVREYALDVVDPIPAPEGAVFDHWIDGWKDCQANIRGLVKDLNRAPSLTDDQQVVLDYLKSMCPPKLGVSAMATVYCLIDDSIKGNWQEYSEEIPEHIEALQKLSVAEENQVFAAFAEWGINNL